MLNKQWQEIKSLLSCSLVLRDGWQSPPQLAECYEILHSACSWIEHFFICEHNNESLDSTKAGHSFVTLNIVSSSATYGAEYTARDYIYYYTTILLCDINSSLSWKTERSHQKLLIAYLTFCKSLILSSNTKRSVTKFGSIL
jgi:hypothetical protein